MNIEKDYTYSATELLQNNVTDFDIMREKPLSFKAGAEYLVCCPLRYYEHPAFIRDLLVILEKNKEIFVKVEFLSHLDYRDKNAISNAINQITIFNDTKGYKKFITKDVPRFIKKWGRTLSKKDLKKFEQGKLERIEFIKMNNKQSKNILSKFTADELLQILMSIWVFNYDVVKKKCLLFIQKLSLDLNDMPESTKQQILQKGQKEKVVMPPFSMKPYNKEILDIFAKQSRMN